MTTATLTIHSTDEEIAAAKTAELVALYNTHAKKQIKKFKDHATAVARVTKMLDELSTAERLLDEEPNHEPEAYGTDDIPATPAPVSSPVPQAEAPATKQQRVTSPEAKAAIAASFKLDRETIELTTGEVFPHAGKIWTMYGTEWMTYAQHDKLTRTLYGAAKKGERAVFEINGRAFALTQFCNADELEGICEGNDEE